MDKNQARQVLIDASVNDYARALEDDDFKEDVARFGFIGFNNFNEKGLITSVRESGLDEFDDQVSAAIAVLEG